MQLLKLKIETIFNFWSYFWILRTKGILIFCQNLSINAVTNFYLYNYINDNNYKIKILSKKIINKFFTKKIRQKIKYFNTIIIIDNINNILNIEKKLKESNILILGYNINNIFFFKNDLNIKKKEKICIYENIKKRINIMFFLNKQIILNLKRIIIKILFLIKKNGNN